MTVNNYLDQFRDLIYNSGYTDSKAVMVKFRQGLDRRISMALAGMTYGRPSDTDLEGWFHLTVRMDQNRAADEAFHISHRQPYVLTPTANHPLAVSRPNPAVIIQKIQSLFTVSSLAQSVLTRFILKSMAISP